MTTSHKIARLLRVIAIGVCSLAGLTACETGPDGGSDLSSNRGGNSGGVREPFGIGESELDLGDDWIHELAAEANATTVGAEGDSAGGSRLRTGGGRGDARGDARAGSGPSTPRTRTSYWGIVLGTFSHDAHRVAAVNMIRSAATLDDRLGSAHVHSSSKGSMVVHGVYEGPDDPAAKRDLEWVKALEIKGRKVFTGVVLTRIHADRARGSFRDIELLSVRRQYPKLSPLYTLQVGAWGDFESGRISLDEIRGKAEAYARGLRGQGLEAYVHHDDHLRISAVTIGLFNHTAVDAQSGIYAPEVEQLMRKFPAHLVNGEPLYELIDKNRPKLGRRPQGPRLMLVPQL